MRMGKGRLLKMHHVSYLVSKSGCCAGLFSRVLGLELAGRMQNDSKFVMESGQLGVSTFESAYVKLPESDFVIELWYLKESKPLSGKNLFKYGGECTFVLYGRGYEIFI